MLIEHNSPYNEWEVHTLRFKKTALLASLLLLFLTSPALAKEAWIEENHLNVRSGPGTEYDRIGQVHEGEQYKIIDEEENWVKIEFAGMEGWVIKDYITIQEDETQESSASENALERPQQSTVTIQQDGIHLRGGASTKFDIIGFAEKGQTFDVVSETENWLEIQNGEISGFVLKNNVINNNEENTNLFKNKTIVIDPGHGGRDVGAIGINGSYEKDYTYLTAQVLEKELTFLGADVFLTRKEDEFVPLESRTALANALDTDAFISIHYNSFPEVPSVAGIETFYYHDQYETLANFVQEEIIKETDEVDRGVAYKDLFVTRQTFKPGILLELGFISNPESEELLKQTEYQKKIATGIVNGLQKYFSMEN